MYSESLVYIVDDDPGMTESLAWVIGSVGLETQLYTDPEAFLKEYDPQKPGCILVDARMPKMSGPELQLKLKNLRETGMPVQPVIFISGYPDLPLAIRVMRLGALNFLIKPFNNQLLLEAINEALQIDYENRIKYETKKNMKKKFSILSSRELQVLAGIICGKPNKCISNSLNISTKTVEAHRASLIRKLGVKSLPELIKIAIASNILADNSDLFKYFSV